MFIYPKTVLRDVTTHAAVVPSIPTIGEPPDILYLIATVNNEGRVYTTSKVHTATSSWRFEYSIGPALSAIMEFPHRWIQREDASYEVVTYGSPIYVVIRPQQADAGPLNLLTTRLDAGMLIDTNVSQVDMVHGWKSTINETQDQGFVIAYVKQGRAYLVQYAPTEGGRYVLSEPQLISSAEGAVQVKLFRSTDYRTNILITYEEHSEIVSSVRLYPGLGATAPEQIHLLQTSFAGELLEVPQIDVEDDSYIVLDSSTVESALDYGGTDNRIISAENESATTIVVVVENAFGTIELPDILVMDALLRPFRAVAVTVRNPGEIHNVVYEITVDSINNALGNISITFTNIYGTVNGAGVPYEEFGTVFVPEGLEPEVLPEPVIQNITLGGKPYVL